MCSSDLVKVLETLRVPWGPKGHLDRGFISDCSPEVTWDRMETEAHEVITIPATLYSWKIPADLLLVPVFIIQAHGVIPPHVNKVCSAAQALLELLTDQVQKAWAWQNMEFPMAPWSYRGIRVRPDLKSKWLWNTWLKFPQWQKVKEARKKKPSENVMLWAKAFCTLIKTTYLHSHASVYREILGRFPNEKGIAPQYNTAALGLLLTHGCSSLIIYFLAQVYFMDSSWIFWNSWASPSEKQS